MKTLALSAALLLGLFAATANAQIVTYYAPAAPVVAPAYYATPYYVTPRRAYYAPAVVAPVAPVAAPVATTTYYAPAPVTTYYAPAAPVVAAPMVVARPVVVGRTIYGTPQLYVPGRPVANTFRAITP
jgi:hypothetical protein